MLLLVENVINVSCSLLFMCAGLHSPPEITLITVQFTSKIYTLPTLYNKESRRKRNRIMSLTEE